MFFNKRKLLNLLRSKASAITKSQIYFTSAVFMVSTGHYFTQNQYNYPNLHMKYAYCDQKQTKEWPTYRKSDLHKHKTEQTGIWVAYKDSVYDITEFIKIHPGGSQKIMLGAGHHLESFFEFYPFHKKDHVLLMLSKYKVGVLHPDDVLKQENIPNFSANHLDEAVRSENLKILQSYPLVAETEAKTLTENFITQGENFFIRNHSKIPLHVDLDHFKLKVLEGPSTKLKKYTMNDLKTKFEPYSVMMTISCAGNRRKGMKDSFPDVQGNNWNIGAIGNSVYTGVLLIDLLKDLGYNLEEIKDKHLIAQGMDQDVQGNYFEISVPMKMVIDPINEITLAYAMNGQDLAEDHGFPLRLIVPGVVGVRNAKWVQKLRISDEEAQSAQQKENYKIIREKEASKIDYSKIPPIFGYVVNSAIGYPLDKEDVKLEKDQQSITLKGWAVGNLQNGIPVQKVEVSFDEGKTWNQADIVSREQKDKSKKVFSWVLWQYKINTNDFKDGKVKAMVRSTDTEGTTQDKKMEEIYNVKGLLNNSIHTIDFSFHFN